MKGNPGTPNGEVRCRRKCGGRWASGVKAVDVRPAREKHGWRRHSYEDSTTKIINITNEANLHINKEQCDRGKARVLRGSKEKSKQQELK
ncbi:hypothetical protein RUM44_006753 [Polyplax serrata]|uniref:Uncharacterized protein n=1 Tax=Polyplax serrata TaxID=468196 RepID=A0ABR1AKJ0_POLSC